MSKYRVRDSREDPKLVVQRVNDPAEMLGSTRISRADGKEAKGAGRSKVAPGEPIKALALCLDAEAVEVSFPYLVLHRSSWKLLYAVNDACFRSLQMIITTGDI